MKSRRAVAEFEATVILVMVSLALVSVVYGGLKRGAALTPPPVFANRAIEIGGGPDIEMLAVNSSITTSVSSLSIGSVSSVQGIMALSGLGYSTTTSLCAAGETTFFSVLASQAGLVQVSTDGLAWISGTWGASSSVVPGWREIMVEDGHSCSITLPGGQQVPSTWSPGSKMLSSLPLQGEPTGTAFAFYIPLSTGPQSVLITSTGGFDDVSL